MIIYKPLTIPKIMKFQPAPCHNPINVNEINVGMIKVSKNSLKKPKFLITANLEKYIESGKYK